jgi:hypothetical protein
MYSNKCFVVIDENIDSDNEENIIKLKLKKERKNNIRCVANIYAKIKHLENAKEIIERIIEENNFNFNVKTVLKYEKYISEYASTLTKNDNFNDNNIDKEKKQYKLNLSKTNGIKTKYYYNSDTAMNVLCGEWF